MNFEWIGLRKILREVTISAKIVNEEPLRVGIGRDVGTLEATDLHVLKVRIKDRELPTIPGSSWKGAFKASSISIARSLDLQLCDGIPKATCLKGNEFESLEKTADVDWGHKLDAILRGDIALCLGCLIFGSPSFHSHTSFSDSYPLNDFSLGYRTEVAINRRTGAVQTRYTVEYVEPGCEFSFKIKVENLPNYALGLLFSAIASFDLGLSKVGGQRSRGFGKVRFEDMKLRVFSFKQEEYGVNSEGKLRPLDPIDVEVPWHGGKDKGEVVTVEGESAKRQLDELTKAWKRAQDKLRKISSEGWRWASILGERG